MGKMNNYKDLRLLLLGNLLFGCFATPPLPAETKIATIPTFQYLPEYVATFRIQAGLNDRAFTQTELKLKASFHSEKETRFDLSYKVSILGVKEELAFLDHYISQSLFLTCLVVSQAQRVLPKQAVKRYPQ